MGDQASRRCVCRDPSTVHAGRVFLHFALSQRRWLSTRGFERRGVARSQREYSAIFVLEIPLRAFAATTARTSGQGKCGAALSPFNCIRSEERRAGKEFLSI